MFSSEGGSGCGLNRRKVRDRPEITTRSPFCRWEKTNSLIGLLLVNCVQKDRRTWTDFLFFWFWKKKAKTRDRNADERENWAILFSILRKMNSFPQARGAEHRKCLILISLQDATAKPNDSDSRRGGDKVKGNDRWQGWQAGVWWPLICLFLSLWHRK